MSLQAFGPRGKTVSIAATSTASTPVQVSSLVGNCFTYQFVNRGSKTCWVWYGKDATDAARVGVPVAGGASAYGVAILANEIVVYNCLPEAWFSAVCSGADTTTLEVTPGEGM